MAEQRPEKEPTIEEMMAATKEPSIEEMMAASKGPDIAPSIEFGNQAQEDSSDEFALGERVTRGARSIAKGATLGFSEVPLGYITAATSLMKQGKMDEAKGLLDNLNAWYESDWKRQKEFEKTMPVVSTGLEMVGGVLPGTPAAKVATMGIKEGAKLGQRMLQAGASGAAGLGAYTAAESVALPESQALEAQEQAKQIAAGAATGALLGPTVQAGIEAIGQAPKVLTSGPVLKVVNTLLGPPVKVLRQYAETVSEIGKLPTVADVDSFFGALREELTAQSKQSDEALLNARENVKRLQESVEKQASVADAARKERLSEAKKQLEIIQEDLRFEMRAARQDFSGAEKQQKLELQDQNMGPHVATVEAAFDELKKKIVDQSASARELISDDVFFVTEDVISAWKNEAQKLKVQGTDVAKGETAKKAIYAIADRVKEAQQLPPRITGQQLKDLIQGYDQDIADGLLRPGQFGSYYDNALKSVRKSMDVQLKQNNDDYARALKPVKDLQDILQKAREETGKAKPAAIEASLKRAKDNPRVYAILEDLEKESGIPVLNVVRDEQKKEAVKRLGPAALPEFQALKNAEAQYEMAKAKDFERAAFASIKDTKVAQEIVELRQQIKALSDPEYAKAEMARATQEGRLTLEQAEQALAGLEQKREEAGKWMRRIIGENISKPEDITAKILRAPDNKHEQAQATKIIEAISQLPTPQFSELLDILTLKNPQDAKKLFRSLRADEAMNKARVNGSRRVNLMRAIFMGMAGTGTGAAMGPAAATTLGAFGALAGYFGEEYGGEVAKAYLRNAVKLQGIPNAMKLMGFGPVQGNAVIRNAIMIQLSDMAAATNPESVYFVSEAFKPAVERDIKQSKMSAVERAKALNELNQLGGVSGKYIRKIMLDATPPVSAPVVPDASEDLEADKPDMLERLSKRTKTQEEKGLRGIVSRLREA